MLLFYNFDLKLFVFPWWSLFRVPMVQELTIKAVHIMQLDSQDIKDHRTKQETIIS